jgi:hypothetical protein
MPYSFNNRGHPQPQRPPEPEDDRDAEYNIVVEGEPTAFDEADEIEAMSDEEFLAMLARQKAEFMAPPADPRHGSDRRDPSHVATIVSPSV